MAALWRWGRSEQALRSPNAVCARRGSGGVTPLPLYALVCTTQDGEDPAASAFAQPQDANLRRAAGAAAAGNPPPHPPNPTYPTYPYIPTRPPARPPACLHLGRPRFRGHGGAARTRHSGMRRSPIATGRCRSSSRRCCGETHLPQCARARTHMHLHSCVCMRAETCGSAPSVLWHSSVPYCTTQLCRAKRTVPWRVYSPVARGRSRSPAHRANGVHL